MSEENVEAVRAAFAAWQQGEPGWTEWLDPEFEWDFSAYPLVGVVDHGVGRENFARFLAGYVATLGDYQQVQEELIDAGDQVVVMVHETVKPMGSDASVERVIGHVWTLRDSKAVRLRVFQTKQEALESVGLSE